MNEYCDDSDRRHLKHGNQCVDGCELQHDDELEQHQENDYIEVDQYSLSGYHSYGCDHENHSKYLDDGILQLTTVS